jgi:hypothetical protein
MEIESATGKTYIPYHRILQILYEGLTVWEKGTKKKQVVTVLFKQKN